MFLRLDEGFQGSGAVLVAEEEEVSAEEWDEVLVSGAPSLSQMNREIVRHEAVFAQQTFNERLLRMTFTGGLILKIAVSTDGNQVSAHFGRCPSFTIAEGDTASGIRKTVIDNPGHHPGFLPEFLKRQGVELIIAGGMGPSAQSLFSAAGIRYVIGVSGNVDDVIKAAFDGTLTGGTSLCNPGDGKGYGVEKSVCDHPHKD